MINAFVICDFDNPLSMRYLSLTQESFSRVEDIITLHPVQCTKPDTMPPPRYEGMDWSAAHDSPLNLSLIHI